MVRAPMVLPHQRPAQRAAVSLTPGASRQMAVVVCVAPLRRRFRPLATRELVQLAPGLDLMGVGCLPWQLPA